MPRPRAPRLAAEADTPRTIVQNARGEVDLVCKMHEENTKFDLAVLRRGLRPFHLHWSSRLRSTNDHAAILRKGRRLFAPAVVLTSRQTAGRGRGGNIWWSNPHVLTVTFVMAAEENLPAHEIPLIAGLAARNAAAELTSTPGIELKWPNDVTFDGRKLAGLLCERVDRVDLIGLGLNVNLDPSDAPPLLRRSITSLLAIAGKTVDRNRALLVVASHLRQAMLDRRRHPFAHFLREYQKHHSLLGRRVTVVGEADSPRVSGKVEGVDEQARLLLRDRGQLHRVVAGHVVPL
jgi:BirA family transcriptional regulator, biotin operon repressor / biotin---[acetyl-CoA-carboxylase] ligase